MQVRSIICTRRLNIIRRGDYNMRKKLLTVAMIVATMAAVTACGGGNADNGSGQGDKNQQNNSQEDNKQENVDKGEDNKAENSNRVIPAGAEYKIAATDEILTEGSEMPETPQQFDYYYYGDYKYRYYTTEKKDYEGWYVERKVWSDNDRTSYGEMIDSILGIDVVGIDELFKDCAALEVAPDIPEGVKSMKDAFHGCESLKEAPAIPTSMENMEYAFARCFSLEKTPEIPEGVTSLRWAFYLCKNLVEATNIPSTAKDASCMFNACKKLTKPPVIAEGVENISSIFSECSSLEQAPELPTTIKNMEQAFYNCINLKTMTRIHKNVTNMTLTFAKCSSLTGTICIDANPEKYKECFQYVDKNGWNIELTGESDMLGTLARERGAG